MAVQGAAVALLLFVVFFCCLWCWYCSVAVRGADDVLLLFLGCYLMHGTTKRAACAMSVRTLYISG